MQQLILFGVLYNSIMLQLASLLQGVKNTTSFTLTNAFSPNFHHRSPLVTLSDPENAKELVEKYDYVAGGNTVVEY